MKAQNTEKMLRQLKQDFDTMKSEGAFTEAQPLAIREQALSALVHQGFPTVKDEFWKYTDLNRFFKAPLQQVSTGPLSAEEQSALKQTRASQLCIFNGVFDSQSSELPQGVTVQSLQHGLGENDLSIEDQSAFGWLNLAYQRDRVQLRVKKGSVVETPIHIDHLLEKLTPVAADNLGVCNSWLEIVIEEGAQVQLVESFFQVPGFAVLTNNHVSVKVESNARCEHLRLIFGAEGSQHFGQGFASQGRDSFYSVTTLSASSNLVRQSYIIEQNGENAESVCNGLYLADGSEHSDHRVVIRHLKPHGISRQLYKGVLKGKARTVFNGKIYIEKDAQKIDSNQLNNNLILSPGAEADSKPELEVYADDVKANHGSAIGRLDQDQLFYLMSRCLSRSEAIQYLARGFVQDVSLHLRGKELRAFAEMWIDRQFGEFQKSIEADAGIGVENG